MLKKNSCDLKTKSTLGSIDLIPSTKTHLSWQVDQTVKNFPAMKETWFQSLGQEDPLEKGMATHFIILAWRVPWTEVPGRLQSTGLQRVGHY